MTEELLHVARDVARSTAWLGQIRYDAVRRPATRLWATDRFEVWLLGWLPGQSVELHDHGGSAAAFTVVRGSLVELTAVGPGSLVERQLDPGEGRVLATDAVHDVLTMSMTPAASIHVYSPALTTMGFYDTSTLALTRVEPVEEEAPIRDDRTPVGSPVRSLVRL